VVVGRCRLIGDIRRYIDGIGERKAGWVSAGVRGMTIWCGWDGKTTMDIQDNRIRDGQMGTWGWEELHVIQMKTRHQRTRPSQG